MRKIKFSQSGITHTKLRNRLQHERVAKMVQVKSGLPGLFPPPVPYKEKEVLRPLRESSVHSPSLNRERPEDSDVTGPELVRDQADFNVVMDRWFGKLA